jgi:hypothetical protein
LSTTRSPKASGDDLGAPPLLTEQPLEHVGGADRAPMREWEAQMDNARFKVVL